MQMNGYCKVAVISLSFLSVVSNAVELKDPYTRDDDISATNIESSATMNAEGLYVYTYDVVASSQNTGSVLQLDIDVSCDEIPDARGFSASDFESVAFSALSEDDKYVPVAVYVPYGQAARGGVSQSNAVTWLLALNPGESSTGLKLVSPYPPGDRAYVLRPSEAYRHAEYDYSGVDETGDDDGTSEVPGVDDWSVRGVTVGPACPGEEYPPGGGGDKFAGSDKGGESDQQNSLLTYSAPLRDQMHTEGGVASVIMTIHYSSDIDPKSFKVTPERNGLKSIFHPVAGGSETVEIPLDAGVNRIKLQVGSVSVPPGHQSIPASEATKAKSPQHDQDVFVFRVPDDMGKGRPSK